MGGGNGTLPAGLVRDVIAKYGAPPGTRPRHTDKAIITLGRIRPRVVDASPDTQCVSHVAQDGLPPAAQPFLGAPDHDVLVEIQRFGSAWIPAGTIPRGASRRSTSQD